MDKTYELPNVEEFFTSYTDEKVKNIGERSDAVNEYDSDKIKEAVDNIDELKEKFARREEQTEKASKVSQGALDIRIDI
ncbi:MAG: hypothetical protein ACLFQ8_03520 [Candidatus Aenigmatarchaeota archaeon]